MKLIPIIADTWKMDGGVAFGVIPRSLWQNFYPVDDNNMIPIVSRCLLLDAGDRKILVETGMGRKQNDRYYQLRGVENGGGIASGLASEGYTCEEITDVVFTHLHDDHVGAAVYRDDEGNLKLLFPNATHWCSASHWKWAMEPNMREAASFFPENLDPLKPLIRMIEDGDELIEGLRFEICNGHTMGQLIPYLHVGDQTFVYAADFIPSHAHIHIPFIASVDIQPLVAMAEKQQFLDLAVENGYILIYEHDSLVEASTVVLTEKGYRIGEKINLEQFKKL